MWVLCLSINTASFYIAIMFSMILFLDPRDNNQHSVTCYFYLFNTNVIHFMLILPYIFRSMRLIKIFSNNYYSNNNQKKTLLEQYYIKVLLIFSIHFQVFIVDFGSSCNFLYFGYTISWFTKIFPFRFRNLQLEVIRSCT